MFEAGFDNLYWLKMQLHLINFITVKNKMGGQKWLGYLLVVQNLGGKREGDISFWTNARLKEKHTQRQKQRQIITTSS